MDGRQHFYRIFTEDQVGVGLYSRSTRRRQSHKTNADFSSPLSGAAGFLKIGRVVHNTLTNLVSTFLAKIVLQARIF